MDFYQFYFTIYFEEFSGNFGLGFFLENCFKVAGLVGWGILGSFGLIFLARGRSCEGFELMIFFFK